MVATIIVFGGAAAVPAVLILLAFATRSVRIPFVPLLATQYLAYLLDSAALSPLATSPLVKYLLAVTVSMIVTASIWVGLRSAAGLFNDRRPSRSTAVILALAVAAVLPGAYVYIHQGYFPDTGRSLFAAPFAGDELRDSNIIAALVEGRRSVYFPNSDLIYQTVWHHGVANAVALLAPPQFSWLGRSLGASLVTGMLFYAVLLWMVAVLRREIGLALFPLFITGALAASDADIVGAVWTWIKAHHIGMAADASTAAVSPFRYFSAALIVMTAPQHASSFIAAALATVFCYRSRLTVPGELPALPVIPLAAAGFATATALIDPVVFIIGGCPLVLSLLLFFAKRPAALHRLLGWGVAVVLATLMLHRLILGFPLWELFLRPRITGGGSGHYGFRLPWLEANAWASLSRIPGLPAEALGIPGVVFAVALITLLVRDRRRLWDPLPLTWIVGLLVWNGLLVETEVQRHYSMVASVIGISGIGVLLPRRAVGWCPAVAQAGGLASAAVAVFLHGVLVQHYSSGGSYLPLAIPWRDYFCINQTIRDRFANLPVVVRTPDSFELPIAAEATTAMVWSQVAFVHQRVGEEAAAEFDALNPRDRKQLKRAVVANPEAAVGTLRRLGFRGVIWGPVEEDGWGEGVRQALTEPAGLLASCGRVGLYALRGVPRAASTFGDPVAEHEAFLARLRDSGEQICRPASAPPIPIVPTAEPLSPGAVNIALHKPARISTGTQTAAAAVDGLIGTVDHPVPVAHSDGSDPSPWSEVDLGSVRKIDSIRIYRQQTGSMDWLRNFYVMVSNDSFHSLDLLPNCTNPLVTVFYHAGVAGPVTVIPVNRYARYVRVQLPDYGYLVLEEVEVFSTK